MPKKIRILGKFQCKKWDFWFIIPDDRAGWGWDFFVHAKNFSWAKDGDRVAGEILERYSGKKPEAKVVEIFSKKEISAKKYEALKQIEGIYSSGRGDFWFVDVPGEEDGYFVYGLKKNGAKDGDRVRADVKKYNGKLEAIVTEVLQWENEVLSWKYSDNDTFGFVKIQGEKEDVFIAWSRKGEAVDGDMVEVEIVKRWWRRPEWKIIKIL